MSNTSIYEKKRLESKICRKYVLSSLNEPQHLAERKREIVTWNLKAKEIFYNLHEKKKPS